MEAIVRNASRLEKLARVDKERFSLTDKIKDAIADIITTRMRKDVSNDNKKYSLNQKEKEEKMIFS
ncbi:MAG: hypothetical protein ACJ72X_12390 [Nitrososphaeraceae archaeon]